VAQFTANRQTLKCRAENKETPTKYKHAGNYRSERLIRKKFAFNEREMCKSLTFCQASDT